MFFSIFPALFFSLVNGEISFAFLYTLFSSQMRASDNNIMKYLFVNKQMYKRRRESFLLHSMFSLGYFPCKRHLFFQFLLEGFVSLKTFSGSTLSLVVPSIFDNNNTKASHNFGFKWWSFPSKMLGRGRFVLSGWDRRWWWKKILEFYWLLCVFAGSMIIMSIENAAKTHDNWQRHPSREKQLNIFS